MSGDFTGLCTRVLELNPMALYVHCYAHKLNLAFQDASNALPYLRDLISFINALVTFVNGSGVRHSLFKTIQNDKFQRSLVHLSNTRWGSRDRCFKSIVKNFEHILYFLQVSQLCVI